MMKDEIRKLEEGQRAVVIRYLQLSIKNKEQKCEKCRTKDCVKCENKILISFLEDTLEGIK